MKEFKSNVVRTKSKPAEVCVECRSAPRLDHWNLCLACWERKFNWPRKTQKKTRGGP